MSEISEVQISLLACNMHEEAGLQPRPAVERRREPSFVSAPRRARGKEPAEPPEEDAVSQAPHAVQKNADSPSRDTEVPSLFIPRAPEAGRWRESAYCSEESGLSSTRTSRVHTPPSSSRPALPDGDAEREMTLAEFLSEGPPPRPWAIP